MSFLNLNEKELFLEYLQSNDFKNNIINLSENLLGGTRYIDQSKSKRTKSERIKLDNKNKNIIEILYSIVSAIRNFLFSFLIPLPIPDALKEKLVSKDQVKTLWDGKIAPFISDLTKSSKYGMRTNIENPFSDLDEELKREKEEEEQQLKREKEIEEREKEINFGF